MNDPILSIVMPVYNGEKYLREAIDSILNQTYGNFEFIILNDGSVDTTEEIILSYADSRIIYVKNEENLQIVKTLNKGIKLAKGKYIVRMDADDISLPERFEKQVQFMEKNYDVSVCGTWVQTYGARENIWTYPLSHEEIKIGLLFDAVLAHPSVMIKKDFFDHIEYEEQYNKAEDYALWVKGIEKYKFSNIPLPLLKYRLHGEQTDKEIQLEVIPKIKRIMVENIGSDLSYSEMEMYLKLISNQYVSFSHAESIFNKLLIANKKSNFFDQDLFEKKLALKFLTSISMNTNKCLQTFYKFQNSSMQKFLAFSPLIYVKLLIKCLIRYFRLN